MVIRDTDTWETRPCGCRLQLSVLERDDTDSVRNMWVIRTECPEHAARSAVLQAALARWQAGEPLTIDDDDALENVRYIDLPLDKEETS
jgi:hypothetical protein